MITCSGDWQSSKGDSTIWNYRCSKYCFKTKEWEMRLSLSKTRILSALKTSRFMVKISWRITRYLNQPSRRIKSGWKGTQHGLRTGRMQTRFIKRSKNFKKYNSYGGSQTKLFCPTMYRFWLIKHHAYVCSCRQKKFSNSWSDAQRK